MENRIQGMVRIIREVTNKEETEIMEILNKYSHRVPHEAIQLTLQVIFAAEDQTTENQIVNDIRTIQEIFPDLSETTIRMTYRTIQNQSLNNVVKQLLVTRRGRVTQMDYPSPMIWDYPPSAAPSINNSLEIGLSSYRAAILKLTEMDASGSSQSDQASNDSETSSESLESSSEEGSLSDENISNLYGLTRFQESALDHLTRQHPSVCPKFLRNKLISTKCNSMLSLEKIVIPDDAPTSTKKINGASAKTHRRRMRKFDDTDYINLENVQSIRKKRKIEKREEELITDNHSSLSNQEMIELCTSKFDVIKFSEAFSDLETHFSVNHGKVWGDRKSYDYAVTSLLNIYHNVNQADIDRCIFDSKCFMEACEKLDKCKKLENNLRVAYSLPEMASNISLLQEVAFKTHYKEIMDYLSERKAKELKLTEARNAGLLVTCNCCYDQEVFPEDMHQCEKGCNFCKLCIKKSVEVTLGYGKLQFQCLNFCPGQFSSDTLKEVMSPEIFKKICFKRQMKELLESGVENLEVCPFCDYVKVMEAVGEVFECLNADCMRKSCRLCKEPHHAPLQCDQVEKDENIKARTYIEEKMTLAILRKCASCGRKFVKTSGCDHVKCVCGEAMCYSCNEYVCICKRGLKGPPTDKQKVITAGRQAKDEVGEKLKIDPLANIQDYFTHMKKTTFSTIQYNLPRPQSSQFEINLQFPMLQIPNEPLNPFRFIYDRDTIFEHDIMFSTYEQYIRATRAAINSERKMDDTEEPQNSNNGTNNSDPKKGA